MSKRHSLLLPALLGICGGLLAPQSQAAEPTTADERGAAWGICSGQRDLAAPPSAQSAEIPFSVPMPPPEVFERTVLEALEAARAAAEPYLHKGFFLREKRWGGFLQSAHGMSMRLHLEAGREYWFWLGTTDRATKRALHIYDADGKLAEAETFQREGQAGVRVVPQKTAAFNLIVEPVKPAREKTF